MIEAVLGIDIGTSAVKAVLVDAGARMLSTGRAPYPTRQPVEGWSEQDPEDWRRAAILAVGAALAEAEAAGGPAIVRAVSFSGHMSAPVLVDVAGRALAPCLTITDQRAAGMVPAIGADLAAALVDRTGNKPVGHLVLPRLLWWQHHHPDIWAATRAVLSPKDWLRAWMTGTWGTDTTDAGNSMLFDPARWDFAPDLAEAAGIDPAKLPPIRRPDAVAGPLLADPAAELGLPAGLPVIVGAADMAAAILGTGVDLSGDVAVTIGTSANVIAGVPGIDAALVEPFNTLPSVEPGVLYAIASHFGGGGALAWLAGLVTGAATPDPGWIGPIAAEAAALPLGSEGLIFLPYLAGAGSPDFDPEARGGFLGLSMKHGRAHLLRAIVEGVSADLCLSIARLGRLAPQRRIVFSGGGSRVPFWAGLLADLSGLPVVPAATADASALGAALLAGLGIGWYGGDLAAARRLAAPRATPIAPGEGAAGRVLRARFAAARRARRPDRLG